MRKINIDKRAFVRSRKGISLVEVVVALAVIAIISAAALSLVVSSAKVDANSLRTTRVMMAAENALECFRFAESDAEFKTLIAKTGNYTSSGDGVYVYTDKNYTVNVKYTDTKLTFTAVDENENEIYSYEFKKG